MQDANALRAELDARSLSGQELGYAEITSLFTAAGNTITDVTGLSITVVETARPYVVEFQAFQIGTSAAGVNANGVITDDLNNQLAGATVFIVTAATGYFIKPSFRVNNPTPGASKTYKARVSSGAGGNTFCNAGATTKSFIQALYI